MNEINCQVTKGNNVWSPMTISLEMNSLRSVSHRAIYRKPISKKRRHSHLDVHLFFLGIVRHKITYVLAKWPCSSHPWLPPKVAVCDKALRVVVFITIIHIVFIENLPWLVYTAIYDKHVWSFHSLTDRPCCWTQPRLLVVQSQIQCSSHIPGQQIVRKNGSPVSSVWNFAWWKYGIVKFLVTPCYDNL